MEASLTPPGGSDFWRNSAIGIPKRNCCRRGVVRLASIRPPLGSSPGFYPASTVAC